MRENVVNEVSTIGEGIYQERNLPLPGWAPELSTMIASATAKAAADAVANAIPSSSVKGTTVLTSSDERIAWVEGVGHVGLCIISR